MARHGLSDADLSRRCRRGDPRAWRELVERQSPLVYRMATRVLRDPAEVEDACQEVFVRIHRSFDSFDPTRPLAPWVARITWHECLRRLGASSRRPAPTEPELLDALAVDGAADPEQRVAAAEQGDRVLEALEALSAQDRALVLLFYREELSQAEVAEAMGMDVANVKTRLFRARKRLAGLLGLAPDGGAA